MQLGQRMKDGATLREHLQAHARQTGIVDPRLVAQLPRSVADLWEAFVSLSASRQAEGGIPVSEVLAWQQLHGVRLSGWDVDTLCAMDRAVMAVVAELRAKQ